MCFLHDDGESVVIAHLVDVAPSDVSDVTKSEPSEAAEEEGLLDHLIETRGMCEPYNFVGMKECFDDNRALWDVAMSHLVDGAGYDGLVYHGFGEHALERAEVVVGADP